MKIFLIILLLCVGTLLVLGLFALLVPAFLLLGLCWIFHKAAIYSTGLRRAVRNSKQ